MRTQRRHIRIRPSRQNNIADKLLAPRPIRPRYNRSLRHARMPPQRRPDRPTPHTHSTPLSLLHRAPPTLQNPLAPPARHRPAAIHPPPRSPLPVRNKTPTPPGATTNKAPTNPSPRDVKL